jgi:quinol monooxygenase YgiN
MILVSGVLVIDPANLDRATELVVALTAATRAEPGNLDYSFSSVLGDPGRLVITERWEDQAAIDEHMVAPHFLEFMGAAGDLGVSHVEIIKYDIAGESKLI